MTDGGQGKGQGRGIGNSGRVMAEKFPLELKLSMNKQILVNRKRTRIG